MPVLLPRSAWTSTPRPSGLTPLTDPIGLAVHYTGSTKAFGPTATMAQSCRRLEAERRLHVAGRGWADIAYLAAVDQAGRVFDLRGAGYRSAANGDQDVNSRYGAITILIGVGDTPTQAAIDAVRWWREQVWLKRWPHATKVVGHRDLYQTACPGDPAYALVRSGAFTKPVGTAPKPIQEDDMPTLDEISAEVWGPQSSFVIPIPSGKGDTTLKDGRPAIAPITALKRILAAVEAGNDPAALAAAIAKHLPAASGVDPHKLAAEVAAELSDRLAD